MSPKRLTVILSFVITLTGLLAISLSFFNQLACEGQPINNNVVPTQAQQIWGNQTIGQSFVAPRDELNQLDILFQTYQRQNHQEVTLRLLELANNTANPGPGKEVFKTSFNAATVSDQTWRTFMFPPIANSGQKTYLITLESPNSGEGDAITVGGIERNSYAPGTAFFGTIPVPADITFRACFQMTTVEKLESWFGQLTRHRSGMWSTGLFYGVSLTIYLILLVGFFGGLAKWAW